MFKALTAAVYGLAKKDSVEHVAATDGHYHYSDPLNNSYPPVTTPLTFAQTEGQQNFQLLLDGTTKGVPDPPQLNASAVFTVGGLATHPITIANLEFQCFLFGAKVYDETYPPSGGSGTTLAVPGTVWTGDVSFDVPPVAPSTEYDININGLDEDGNILFALQTAFRF